MRLIPIDSISDPRVAEYANMRDAELRHRTDPSNPVLATGGLFMAEGGLVFEALASSGYRTVSVLTTPARLDAIRSTLDRLPEDTPVYLAPQELMNGIVGFNMHRGILALGARGPEPDLDDLLATTRTLVILEDLVNHDNLGGIFRSTAALAGGANRRDAAILLSPRSADPLYRKALRVSMGHALNVPFRTLAAWPGDLKRIRQAGFRVLALANRPGAVDLPELGPRAPEDRVAILLGTEGPGLTETALAAADVAVRIPIAPGVDSLNVAVAGAIALYALTARDGRQTHDS